MQLEEDMENGCGYGYGRGRKGWEASDIQEPAADGEETSPGSVTLMVEEGDVLDYRAARTK